MPKWYFLNLFCFILEGGRWVVGGCVRFLVAFFLGAELVWERESLKIRDFKGGFLKNLPCKYTSFRLDKL
jgi:hypothetical protein